MQPDIAETLVEDFERGLLSRRQLACRLMGLGAALAVMPRAAEARQGQGSTFQATGLDHVALNVRSVPRSRDFYIKHLGLKVGCPVCAHFVHYTSRRNRVPPRRGFRVEVQ